MVMQPLPPPQSNQTGESDMSPLPTQAQTPPPPAQAQSTPAGPNMAPTPQGSDQTGESDMSPNGDQGSNQNNQIVQALQQHLDQLPDQDKAFLAQHLTPEFVRAIGLINGPEVAGYLDQFADPNKVLVPVPRAQATAYLQKLQQQQQAQGGQQPQGQPQQPAPQQQPQAATQKPMQMPQQPPQQLPNGVTPAPMQHGIMAPR